MSKARLYQLASLCIVLGLVLLCQPLRIAAFSAGFPILLAGVVLHIVLDHVGS